MLLHPLRTANKRIERWVLRRVSRQPGPLRIVRRRIYILPTRHGVLFGLMLTVMLLGAMNYSNSLAFALTFLLAGIGLVCMHHTHGNLVNLELNIGRAAPVFANSMARFPVMLRNPSGQMRLSISAALDQRAEIMQWVDVPDHASAELQLAVPAPRRGPLPAPRFTVSTSYPLGLFHAWTWAELDNSTVVYPRPADVADSVQADGDEGEAQNSMLRGQDDFVGVRSYERGDARSAIHWKSVARTQQMVVKQFARSTAREQLFDFSELRQSDTELRLSLLCRAVLDAHAGGQRYALRLPGLRIDADSGERHRDRCLRALAMHGHSP